MRYLCRLQIALKSQQNFVYVFCITGVYEIFFLELSFGCRSNAFKSKTILVVFYLIKK
jgi:hypothetical protein